MQLFHEEGRVDDARRELFLVIDEGQDEHYEQQLENQIRATLRYHDRSRAAKSMSTPLFCHH